MGLREFLEKNKKFVVPGFFGAAVLLLGFSVWNTRQDRQLPGPISQAFYTDDEGKTYFVDALEKTFPFDRNGKTAYRAYVFTCDDKGKPFVGMIGRQAKSTSGPAVDKRYTTNQQVAPIEVKKPGDDKWVPFMSAEGQKLLASVCPSGHALAVQPGGSQ